jgi:hypothetical protein
VEHDFEIRNSGVNPGKILQVRSSCGCTVGQASPAELPPGGKSTVHVRFDTSGRTGRQHKSVYVQTTDAVQPVLTCLLSGEVVLNPTVAGTPPVAESATPVAASRVSPAAHAGSPVATVAAVPGVPRLQVAETRHDFGRVRQGAKLEHPFLFRNVGGGQLTLSPARSSADWVEGIVRPMALGPGFGGRVWVLVNTAKLAGRLDGTVTVATSDPQLPELVLTVTVEVLADSVSGPRG